jgi:hypothetical protein
MTYNQELHRIYLSSPLWKEIRQRVIRVRGRICQKCGNHGSDVHHLTYERWGGAELDSDLQILCRVCHEAIHAAERCSRQSGRRRGRKSLNVTAVIRTLTGDQLSSIGAKFNREPSVLLLECSIDGCMARRDAMRFLQVSSVYGIPIQGKRRAGRQDIDSLSVFTSDHTVSQKNGGRLKNLQ